MNQSLWESLPASVAEKVNEICDRFESAWKAGTRPRLEEYLKNTSEPERTALLRELILVELAYRRRKGEKPLLEGCGSAKVETRRDTMTCVVLDAPN